MVTSKYTLFDSNFDSVELLKNEWSWGDQSLELEPEIGTGSNLGPWAVEHIVNLLGWYGRRIGVPYRFFGFLLVTKDDQIRQAFADPHRFNVPFGPEMNALAGPPVFGLGDDGDEHDLQRAIMLAISDPGDAAWIGGVAREYSEALLAGGRGKIDAIDDLIKPVLAETCFRWYGLSKADPHAFVSWSNAISNLIFATPTGASEIAQRRAFEGARRLKALIQSTLEAPQDIPQNSLLGRLLGLKAQNVPLGPENVPSGQALTDERIISLLVGMISGSAPTTLIAAAYGLRTVFAKSGRIAQAQEAAKSDTANPMRQIVRECFRLRPATWPGVFRRVNLSGKHKTDFANRKLRNKETVVLGVASGLRDETRWPRPSRFDPSRMDGTAGPTKPSPDLAFGLGGHDCVGRYVAEEITTSIFGALFAHDRVQRAGRMRSRGAFPAAFPLTYNPIDSITGQELVVAVIPSDTLQQENDLLAVRLDKAKADEEHSIGRALRERELNRLRKTTREIVQKEIDAKTRLNIDKALAALNGNPAQGALRDALNATGIVHTHSISLISVTRDGVRRPHLAIEFNLDGPRDRALPVLDYHLGAFYQPLFAALGYQDTKISTLIRQFDSSPGPRLYGHAGVAFNGIPEWTVKELEINQTIAEIAEAQVQAMTADHATHLQNAANEVIEAPISLRVMEQTRQVINQNPFLARQLIQPKSRGPAFARHKDRTLPEAFRLWLRSSEVQKPVALVVFGFVLLGYIAALQSGVSGFLDTLLATLGFGLGLFLLVATIVGGSLWWALRRLYRQEAKDLIDNRYVPLEHNQSVTDSEDADGLQQNHFIALNTLKPGLSRRIVLAVGFFMISRQVVHWFRPGFVTDLGTIRHARWLRVKGSRELLFQASFDGSWERYLEDFSDKVAQGQTLIWGNCEGFPKTTKLFADGANDGERFKRWVRGRQVKTSVWYSRFDTITNDRIRRNALIREGLSRVPTREEADRWLRLFGSSPRVDPDVLEKDQIQSIVLNGFGKHPSSVCLGLNIVDPEGVRNALRHLLSPQRPSQAPLGQTPLQITFGTSWHESQTAPCTLGFSARGLMRMGVPQSGKDANACPQDFPLSFAKGMGRRARTLGDDPGLAVDWIDTSDHASGEAVDIAVILVTKSADMRHHYKTELLQIFGPSVSVVVDIATELPVTTRAAQIHDPWRGMRGFGFLDGVAQPLIRGAPGVPDNHPNAIDPGEFILGYKDERNLIGPSPTVPSSWDRWGDLPDAKHREKGTWPDFTDAPATTRDLGRNGSYLVLRQLQVNSSEFHDEMTKNGKGFGKDWVAEKMIGRRNDGETIKGGSLRDEETGHRHGMSDRPRKKWLTKIPYLQDLSYAKTDPLGDTTPLGSHVRRANPRDSLDGGAESAPGRNRHRILRRGRSYTTLSHSGLLFGCLNASIERQFEFVQQTWINSTSFHGLWGERDPLFSNSSTQKFSISTKHGCLHSELNQSFVQFRGGGYFFLPSRAALTAISRSR